MTRKGFTWLFVLMWIFFFVNIFALIMTFPEKPGGGFAVLYFIPLASEIILFCCFLLLFSGSFNNLLYKNWTVVEHFTIKDHNLRPIYREYNGDEGKVIIWTVDGIGNVKRGILKDEQTHSFLKMALDVPTIEVLPKVTTLSGDAELRNPNLPDCWHTVKCVDVVEQESPEPPEVNEIADNGDIKT